MTTLFGSLMLDIHGTWLTAEDRQILRQRVFRRRHLGDVVRVFEAQLHINAGVHVFDGNRYFCHFYLLNPASRP